MKIRLSSTVYRSNEIGNSRFNQLISSCFTMIIFLIVFFFTLYARLPDWQALPFSPSKLASFEPSGKVYAGHCDEEGNYENLYRYCDGNEIWEDTEDCDHERVETCDDDQTCQDAECVDDEEPDPDPDPDPEPDQCPDWSFDHNECTECGYARTVESQSETCGGDTRISREHVRDRGCDGEEWCGEEPPPSEDPEPTPSPTPRGGGEPDPDPDPEEPAGPVCSEKLCIYSEETFQGLFKKTTCYVGHCLDGSENCDFNDNCGYVDNSCDQSGDETDCYVVEPVIIGEGKGDVGNAICKDNRTYCDSSTNTLIWKNGGRAATQAEKNAGLADSEGCVYAFTPQGSCAGGSTQKPSITAINTAPDLNCKSVGTNSFECNTPTAGSSFSFLPQVNSPDGSASQCYWKINANTPDLIARGCNLNRTYAEGDYFSVAPTNSHGQGASVNITFKTSETSTAPSCPATGGDYSKTTATKAYPENGKGHCTPQYCSGGKCDPNTRPPGAYTWCYAPSDPNKTNANFAMDIANGSTNEKFVLPAIQGKNVNWQKVSGPYCASGGSGCQPTDSTYMGSCMDYQGSTSTGEVYYLHACHVLQSSITSQASGGPSGTIVANKLTSVGMDGWPHLHFTISKKQSNGNWQMQEPNATLNMCK